jgi:hypothetical protein
MGKLGVFGVYVTSAAAKQIPVYGDYERDPALPSVKEPQKDAVLRTKILLEAGFLSAKLGEAAAKRIDTLAAKLFAALDAGEDAASVKQTNALASACRGGWKTYWR